MTLNIERFRELYISGAKYTQIKKELGISFATINAYRIRLNLPKREKSCDRFEVDEELFRELYDSRDPYYTYVEIAEILGCCGSLIVNIRRRLGMSDREPKPRLTINEEKFKQMYLDPNNTHDMLCDEFNICVDTIRRLKKKYNLPDRKKKSTYDEKLFIESYNGGLSNHQLSATFGMERKTVALRIKELGLPPRSARENKKMMVIESPEPAREAKVTVPVLEPMVEKTSVPKINDRRSTQFFVPPTLRQLQKEQNNIAMQRAQRDYRILKKENGFSSLIGKEIENPTSASIPR
jgi:hypothetical protein